MKRKLLFSVILFLLLLSKAYSQICSGTFGYQYSGTSWTLNFQDSSSTDIITPQIDYINWNFGDGGTGTGTSVSHHFLVPSPCWVKREVKYSEIGNPSNFCIKLDSIYTDPLYTGPTCNPSHGFHVTWLTGTTYGIASYYYGCPYNFYNIFVDSAAAGVSISTSGPNLGIYSSSLYYFTYTFPDTGDYEVVQEFLTNDVSPFLFGSVKGIYHDSIPVTPSGCHASFFMIPDSAIANDWTLYNYSTGSGSSTYFWDFGDGNTSTLPNPSHTYAATGNYNICLTISDGTCSDTYCDSAFFNRGEMGAGLRSFNVVKANVGIKEIASQINFSIYPDPAENELTVSFADNNIEKTTLSIYDMMGRIVSMKKSQVQKNNNINVDISNLDPGMYLLKVVDGGRSTTKRFVKK
ncbi:MAG: PKD domain-containing protein [Bacteroidia bacterium]